MLEIKYQDISICHTSQSSFCYKNLNKINLFFNTNHAILLFSHFETTLVARALPNTFVALLNISQK